MRRAKEAAEKNEYQTVDVFFAENMFADTKIDSRNAREQTQSSRLDKKISSR